MHQIDAADRYNRMGGLAAGPSQLIQPHDWGMICLGGGVEDWAKADVMDRKSVPLSDLRQRMSRESQNAVSSHHGAGGYRRKIILAEMHSGGAADQRKIATVVYDDRDIEPGRIFHAAAQVVEQFTQGRFFVADLNERSTASNQFTHNCKMARLAREALVGNRIYRRQLEHHGCQRWA